MAQVMEDYSEHAKVPFVHPTKGWMYQGRQISPECAEKLCNELGIPYAKVTESDPINWYPVLDTVVAGVYFIPDFGTIARRFKIGQDFKMVRENNPHDPLAVALYIEDGIKVGYVPRKDNPVISRLMDAGEVFSCTVTGLNPMDSLVRVRISVFRGRKVRRHFSMYSEMMVGTRIFVDSVPATRGSRTFIPLSGNYREFEYAREFSDDDLWELQWGHISQSMEDRWNFFMEGTRMFISRSWSGHCIFEVDICSGASKARLENDESVCRIPDEEVNELLDYLFDSWLCTMHMSPNSIPPTIFGNVAPYGDIPMVYRVDNSGIIWMEPQND